jgi:Cu/Ag efflux protein CusF
MSLRTLLLLPCLLAVSCGSNSTNTSRPANNASTAKPTATEAPTPKVPANGDYPGKAKVTKINVEGGSIGLNHEEIKDVMPAMEMEFFVSDKNLFQGLTNGDAVDFTLRYKDGQETIIAITKAK